MSHGRRSLVLALQVLFLCSVLTLWIVGEDDYESCSLQPLLDSLSSCDSDEGSDHGPIDQAVQAAGDPGTVTRYHDLTILFQPVTLAEEDLTHVRSRLPHEVIGLQVPQAPGVGQPGELTTDPHEVQLHLDDQRGDAYDVDVAVPLVPDDDAASQIEAVLPADPGTHWQALVPANDDFLADIPTEEATLVDGLGYLVYTLDFLGADPCNGCTVKLTACWNEDVPPSVRWLLRGRRLRSGNGLTCFEPFPTTIFLTHGTGAPPDPPVAWLSPWGGPFITGTYGPSVELAYALGHSGPGTETFRLEPIDSEKGWSYAWYDLDDHPISQVDASSGNTIDANVKVVGTGIPTCISAMDTIHIMATSVTTPSLRAVAVSKVSVRPDPEMCATTNLGIDLSVEGAAGGGVIYAGEPVTYTLTITNHGPAAPVAAALVDTWTPVTAVVGVHAPGCEVDVPRGTITCTHAGLGLESVHLPDPHLVLTTNAAYSGTLTNRAVVTPTGGVADPEPRDNSAAPVEVTVRGGEVGYVVYLPIVIRRD
jgi:uncharacterized repeat protein (TIGR01451 family)